MKKILTLVLDGFGLNDEAFGNAIKEAKTPTLDRIFEEYPSSSLFASGKYLGLPENMPGNKSVGYESIALGRVLKQRSTFAKEFTTIDSLETNPSIKDAIAHVKKHKSTFHLIGLMSDGLINSNIKDTIKIAKFLESKDIDVVVDFISDGVDVPKKSAIKYVEMHEENEIKIASLCGRYYAMDDGKRYDRTKIYYDLIRNGVGLKVKELKLAIKNCYIRDILDQHLPPIIVMPDKNIKDNDALLWMNYEKDNSYQTLVSLINPEEIKEFSTRKLTSIKPLLLYPVDPKINATVLIVEESDPSNSLGLYLGSLGLTQARIADEENYDFVTFYFNGKITKKILKCNTLRIDLKRKEKDYEKIASVQITKEVIKAMERDTDFILASLSAADDISKKESYEKTIDMIEFLDECLKRIIESAELNFYTVIITSTHGNVESLLDSEGNKTSANTNNNVPFIIMDKNLKLFDGALCNIAPTILDYMDIKIPESMQKNRSLIKNK